MLNDEEAYYAFHEFNSDIEIEELALTKFRKSMKKMY